MTQHSIGVAESVYNDFTLLRGKMGLRGNYYSQTRMLEWLLNLHKVAVEVMEKGIQSKTNEEHQALWNHLISNGLGYVPSARRNNNAKKSYRANAVDKAMVYQQLMDRLDMEAPSMALVNWIIDNGGGDMIQRMVMAKKEGKDWRPEGMPVM